MDSASDFGSGGCGFESHLGLFYLCYMYLLYISYINVRGSIVVSIPACHAGDPGSIPGRGAGLSHW